MDLREQREGGADSVSGQAKAQAGHTPGPWRVEDHGDELLIFQDINGRPVGDRLASHSVWGESEKKVAKSRANLRVIAAAPLLLEKAKRLLLTHGCGIVDLGHCADCDDMRAAIRAAEPRS